MRLPCSRFVFTVFICALLTIPVSSFGVTAQQQSPGWRGKSASSSQTSLKVSSIAPPENHLAWLRRQDEEERKRRRSLHHRSSTVEERRQEEAIFQQSSSITSPFASLGELASSLVSAPTSTQASCSAWLNVTAKDLWATRFTTVDALRQAFGSNRNPVWGDLDASTTRLLYKTLLPRALLELYHCHGVSSQELAPLAYRARVAAKLYARERCFLPARVGAYLYDGMRQWMKYGQFQMSGMSYLQLWEKYAAQVIEEDDFSDEEDLTSKVCYKILEKSCETNAAVDSIFLDQSVHDLQEITRKLEQEVHDLVDLQEEGNQKRKQQKWAVRRYKMLRTLLRIRRQMEGKTYTEEDDETALVSVLKDAQS